SNAKITPLFEKQVSASDVARIGRLVLQKRCAEAPLTSATATAPAATQVPAPAVTHCTTSSCLPDMGSNALEPARNDSVYESNVIPTTLLLTSGQNSVEPDVKSALQVSWKNLASQMPVLKGTSWWNIDYSDVNSYEEWLGFYSDSIQTQRRSRGCILWFVVVYVELSQQASV
ncbi:hypothetical protein Tco_1325471, partial [Tanacetum coccineum]